MYMGAEVEWNPFSVRFLLILEVRGFVLPRSDGLTFTVTAEVVRPSD